MNNYIHAEMSDKIIPASQRSASCNLTNEEIIKNIERLIAARCEYKPAPDARFVLCSNDLPEEVISLYTKNGFTVMKAVKMPLGNGSTYTQIKWD
jgi:hypothetical protein